MRYLVLLKAAGSDRPPPPELMEAIMALGQEASMAGALIDTQGLQPSAAGARGLEQYQVSHDPHPS